MFRVSVSYNFFRLMLVFGLFEWCCYDGGCFENSLINFCLFSVLEYFINDVKWGILF